MEIQCTKCKEVKDSSLFHSYSKKKNGFTSQCKSCRNLNRKEQYWKNPELAKKKQADYRSTLKQTDPEKVFSSNRASKLKSSYNLTLDEYDKKLKDQNYKCDVCGKEHQEEVKKRLVVDHCHETKIVRSLLCANCNTALGLLKENIETIEALKNYLIKFRKEIKWHLAQ